MATYEWKVSFVPDYERYPQMKERRTHVDKPTTLLTPSILEQVRREFRKLYGNVAAPDSFELEICEKDGKFNVFSTDAQLERSVAGLEERDRLLGLHFQAIPKYTGRGNGQNHPSGEDVIILPVAVKSDVKITIKAKRFDDSSSQGSSSISFNSMIPAPQRAALHKERTLISKPEPVPSTSKDRQKSASPYQSEVEVEGFGPLASPAPCRSHPVSRSPRNLKKKASVKVPIKSPAKTGRRTGTKLAATPTRRIRITAARDATSERLPRSVIRLPRGPQSGSPTKCMTPKHTLLSPIKKRDRPPKNTEKSATGPRAKKKKPCGKGTKATKATTTSVWLRQVLPLRLRYCPQIGDEVLYFPERHMAVRQCILHWRIAGSENVSKKDLQPWSPKQTLGFTPDQQTGELVVVKAIDYRIIKTKQADSNRLAVLQLEHVANGKTFIIHLQDVPCEDDYLIPRKYYDKAVQGYEESKSRDFLVGKRARVICWSDAGCSVPKWENGSIIEQLDPRSMYQSLNFRFDDAKLRKKVRDDTWYAPWEVYFMEVGDREPASGTLLTDDDVRRYGYGFHSEDYGHLLKDISLLADRLFPVFDTLLGPTFHWAKDLQTKADLGDDYESEVAYPVWLTLIKDRLQSGFYRRQEALIFDIQQLPSTAKNCFDFCDVIVRAKITRDVLLEVIANPKHPDLVELGKKYEKDHDDVQGNVEQGPVKSWTTPRMREVVKGPSIHRSSIKRSSSHDGPPRKMSEPYRGGC